MKPDTERMMRAYLKVYDEFRLLYFEEINANEDDVGVIEEAKLFEIAWNDSHLGELLREEVMEEYKDILEQEQVKREIEEEAEAGEAMII